MLDVFVIAFAVINIHVNIFFSTYCTIDFLQAIYLSELFVDDTRIRERERQND